MSKLLRIVLLTAFLAMALPAHADSANRVGLLEDARADFALRLKLIEDAHESVDLIMSQFTSDSEIGLPLLLAMREAAKRGVRVRLLSGYFPSVFSKSTAALRLILNDDSLKPRPLMILDGELFHTPIPCKDATMWTSFDEKILIADGTRAVIGGRNVGFDYLHWLDNSLYLDGPIVTELQNGFFDPAWTLAYQLSGRTTGDRSLRKPWLHEAYGPFRLTPSLAQGMA